MNNLSNIKYIVEWSQYVCMTSYYSKNIFLYIDSSLTLTSFRMLKNAETLLK